MNLKWEFHQHWRDLVRRSLQFECNYFKQLLNCNKILTSNIFVGVSDRFYKTTAVMHSDQVSSHQSSCDSRAGHFM